MAKRFTDTDKWKRLFIRGLDASHKLLWFYILDDCDHAGIWLVDFEVASIRCGFTYNHDDVLQTFNGQVEVIKDSEKWFIRDFIEFQYGTLNPENRAHNSVLNILKKNGIKPLKSPLKEAKDKDKDKELVKEKVKEVVDFLNVRLSTNYNPTSKATADPIKARINDGYNVEDFKMVIDKKANEWESDPNFSKFLRPQTLFSQKFESYLNQVEPTESREEQLDVELLKHLKNVRSKSNHSKPSIFGGVPSVPEIGTGETAD